ncbi:unnamed protein product [Menidia menidia]|uniref:(Atlantic silverside) hypothetical protein n=1 Tax=Menidia menidia TaxID=238744 RepID=A0A8S4APA5_9TELE|nr:unnamed protein product [Menidia menidia]
MISARPLKSAALSGLLAAGHNWTESLEGNAATGNEDSSSSRTDKRNFVSEVRHDLQEVAPELLPDEGVQDGVEAAVEVGHVPGHGQDLDAYLLLGAAPLAEQRPGVDQQRGVEGQVAGHEHQHHGQHHADGLPPLAVLRPHQRARHAPVAERHRQERHQEAHRHLQAGHQQLDQSGRVVAELAVEQRGKGQNPGEDPDRQTDEAAVDGGFGAEPEGAAGPDDGHVAVPANTGQQQHAAVQVDAVGRAEGLAGRGAHGPGAALVVRDEGQRQHEEQVRNRHVDQVHVRHGLGPLVEDVGGDHHAVAQQAEHEDGGVDVGLRQELRGGGSVSPVFAAVILTFLGSFLFWVLETVCRWEMLLGSTAEVSCCCFHLRAREPKTLVCTRQLALQVIPRAGAPGFCSMSKSGSLRVKNPFKFKSPEKDGKLPRRAESLRDPRQDPGDLHPGPGPLSPGDASPSPVSPKEKKGKRLFPFKLRRKKSKSSKDPGEVFFPDTDELDKFNSHLAAASQMRLASSSHVIRVYFRNVEMGVTGVNSPPRHNEAVVMRRIIEVTSLTKYLICSNPSTSTVDGSEKKDISRSHIAIGFVCLVLEEHEH